MAASDEEEKIAVKLLVNNKNGKIVFAEADGDFADVLLSFLLLPLGVIVKLLDKDSPFGSLGKIYKSFTPTPSMLAYRDLADFSKLRVDYAMLRDGAATAAAASAAGLGGEGGVFVKDGTKFIVTDDLHLLPDSWASTASVLEKMGIEDGSDLEGRRLDLGRQEIVKLLKQSLISNNPLTDICFKNSTKHRARTAFVKEEMVQVKEEKGVDSGAKKIDLKLLVNKADDEPLCMIAGNDMTRILVCFLFLPLCSVIKLLDKNTFSGCIDNLCTSARSLGVGYIKSDTYKKKLLSNVPKFDPLIKKGAQSNSGKIQVLPNLDFSLHSTISLVQLANSLKVPFSNLVEKDVAFGET